MKKSMFKSLLVAGLLFAGSPVVMAETEEVYLDGVTYILDSESMTAKVDAAMDVSGDIVLPESVSYDGETYALTSIGEEAFAECGNITSLSIPSSVTSIGVHAFASCGSLTSVNIPSGVTSIEEGTFEECKKLASIDIPYGVTTIGHHAFYDCEKLTSVLIPNSVDSIGDWAFIYCTGLTSIDIPSSVKYIGECAFYWCTRLTSVEIPFGVTSINSETFYFCTNLTSVTIPSSVTSIGESAFVDCSRLASVSLPSSVTSIGNQAFYGCRSFTSIDIPSSVVFIGDSAFNGCNKVERIVVEEGNKFYDSRDNCNAIVETATNKLLKACINSTIPYGIETIGKGAFVSLYYLTSVDIPSSVTSIEDGAFDFCGLTSVTIPSSVTSMGVNPFASCTKIQTFTVEDGNKFYDTRNGCNAIIETATGRLVSGCNTSTIPYGVTAIGEGAFEGCGFSSIDIPSSVTSIGRFAFLMSYLTSVDIPSSVKSIREKAFGSCFDLASVTFRSSAISIGAEAFATFSTKDVYIYGSEMVENYSDEAFANVGDDTTLHVDASLVDKYKATSPWCDWFADIVALDGETGIENAEANAPETYRVYSVDGKSLPTMQKGLNILRSKTGKCVKVMK